MVSRQFPGYDFVRKNFKFKVPVDGSEPALDIHYESTLPHGWVAPLKGFTREVSLSIPYHFVASCMCAFNSPIKTHTKKKLNILYREHLSNRGCTIHNVTSTLNLMI